MANQRCRFGRAKLWLYAASPLLNGGYREALSLTNPDGTRLFPDRDDNKWNTALNACKDFIDYAETGNRYELYKEYTTSSTGEQILDVDASVYNLFQKSSGAPPTTTGEDLTVTHSTEESFLAAKRTVWVRPE